MKFSRTTSRHDEETWTIREMGKSHGRDRSVIVAMGVLCDDGRVRKTSWVSTRDEGRIACTVKMSGKTVRGSAGFVLGVLRFRKET